MNEAAVLYSSARPCKLTDLQPFVAMMDGQRTSGGLVSLEEEITGHRIAVFGNIAVALSGFTLRVNSGDQGRGVNGFLLIKQDGQWQVGAMCWDNATADRPVPDDLRGEPVPVPASEGSH